MPTTPGAFPPSPRRRELACPGQQHRRCRVPRTLAPSYKLKCELGLEPRYDARDTLMLRNDEIPARRLRHLNHYGLHPPMEYTVTLSDWAKELHVPRAYIVTLPILARGSRCIAQHPGEDRSRYFACEVVDWNTPEELDDTESPPKRWKRADGTYELKFDLEQLNNGQHRRIKRSKIIYVGDFREPPYDEDKIRYGQDLYAKYGGDAFYAAKVIEVHDDGKFDVRFSDKDLLGTVEQRMPRKNLKNQAECVLRSPWPRVASSSRRSRRSPSTS